MITLEWRREAVTGRIVGINIATERGLWALTFPRWERIRRYTTVSTAVDNGPPPPPPRPIRRHIGY